MRFTFDEFEFDVPGLELRRLGKPVTIGTQPLALLLHLIRHRDRVVSRAELHELLWQDTAIGETSLGQSVRYARQALGDDGRIQRFIRNVRGRGYRFVAAVDEAAGASRGPTPHPEAPPAASRSTAFFGREPERASLQTAIEATQHGHGDAVWIAGEEGIGKSLLLDEVARYAASQGAQVLRGGCNPGLWASPFGPFARIIASTRSLPAAEPSWSGADAAVLSRISQHPEDLAAPPEAKASAREDERLRIFEATATLFSRLASSAPLVLLLDDLHSADAATLSLLYGLARRAVEDGWLVVGALRDDERPAEAARLEALQELGDRRAAIRLFGLNRSNTSRLLESFAGRPLPPDLATDIHTETGGNPFFARETLRHLLEEGCLVDESGGWQQELRLEFVSLPVGVRQVLSRRLAALGPVARELLTVASAEPGTFHFEVVRRAAQLDEALALDGLDEVLDANVITTTDEAEVYRFCHDLTRRVVYSEQSPARRVRLHRRLAETLVAVLGPRASQQPERIARHYRASAELSGAEAGVAHCVVSADRAASVAAWEDEAAFLEMALALQPPGDPSRFGLLQRYGLALSFGGATSDAARIAAEAATMVEERNGRSAAADYLVNVVSGVAWGASDLAWDLSERARRLVNRDDPLTWARLRLIELWRNSEKSGHPLDTPEHRQATVATLDNWSSLEQSRKNGLALVGLAFESRAEVLERAGDTAAFLALWAGEYEEAIARFREDVDTAETHAGMTGAYFYLCTIARLYAALGRPEEAYAALAESEQQLEGLPMNTPFRIVRASMRSGLAQLSGAGYEELIPLFEEAIVEVDEGSKWMMPTAMCVGAEVFALAGREDDARRMLEAGLPGLVRSPGWMTTFTLVVNSAVGAMWALNWSDWSTLLEKQLREKTLEPDFRFPSVDARLSMARICALQNRYEEAATWFEQARVVLDEQSARPLRAITDLDEARMLCSRNGPSDLSRARTLIRAAQSGFRAIGMPGWIERAQALQRRVDAQA